MKNRSGFVSNSSSSSFVISSPANKKTHKITIEIPLERFGIKITTKEQFDKKYIEWKGMTDLEEMFNDVYLLNEYKGAVAALERNRVVWLCQIGNDDYNNPVVSDLYAECETGREVVKLNPELEEI